MVRCRAVLASLATSLVVAAPSARAQPDPGFLEQFAATYHFRLGRPASIRPVPDGRAILFLRSGPRSFQQDLYEYDVAAGQERILLAAARLLGGADERITPEERARRERMRVAARGVTSFQLSKDGARVLVPLSGRLFVLDRADGSVREVAIENGPPEAPRLSPDGARIAYVRDGDLYVVETAGGPPLRLTHDAGASVTNGLAEFVAQEEMGRHSGFWWSPDSAHIACQQTDISGVEELTVPDLVRPERPAQTFAYPRPGRRNAAVRLGIVPAAGGPREWVEWDRETYPYLAAVTWEEHAPLTLLLQNRRQTREVLVAVRPGGAIEELLAEEDDAWIDLDGGMPMWLRDGSAFLWTTERRGALQLELRERDGRLRHVLTPLDAGLQGVVHLDERRGRVCVRASADPTETHLQLVPLDPAGPAPRPLSTKPGIHGAVFSENGEVFVHTYGGMSDEWITVRRAEGEYAGDIVSVAEAPRLGLDLSATVQFTTAGGDPAMHAAIIRPRNFEPGRAYPVIEHAYAGPGSQMVRKSARGWLLDQWIADHGYIVVAVDGRGTGNRGRGWQRAVKGDLVRLPLEDHAAALRALGRAFPEIDAGRAGVYGWSFGGYFAAHAAMRRPDVYRAAVAGAPVADWLDYDTHYTERYMGLPSDNPSGYRDASALTWAGDLSAALLIVHGTSDDNVYFMHSLKLADALFRAGRPFEMLPLAGFTHMVPDPVATARLYERIMRFFGDALGP
jgi:dipeptidyl-peptidase-4